MGLAIIAGGIVLAVYGTAAMSGLEGAASNSFRAAMYALTALTAFVVLSPTDEGHLYAVAAPVIALGVGGAYVLPPVGDTHRSIARLVAVGLVALLAVGVYWVDHTVYAMIAMLLPLPAVALGDKFFHKVREVLAEESP